MANEWSGEPLKVVIKFTESISYTIYSTVALGVYNYIHGFEKIGQEANTISNPLGVQRSGTCNLQIYDASDYLSPTNTTSPYYGKMVNGVEYKVYISYDNVNWSDYGTYYVTNWSGSYSEGGHNYVTVSGCDRLESLGSKNIPKLEAYADVFTGDLITNVLTGLGLTESEFVIDASLDTSLSYGITNGSKVREFLNNICQVMFARVVVDIHNVIQFVPALTLRGNTYTLSNNIIDSLSNKNTSCINYNKLQVKYLKAGSTLVSDIISDSSYSLSEGDNTITDVTFKDKVLAVYQLNIKNKYTSGISISSLNHQSYQDGMEIDCTLTGGGLANVYIYGQGLVLNTTEKYVETTIPNSSISNGSTLIFDSKMVMDETKASNMALQLKSYIEKMSTNVVLTCYMTPAVDLGDNIILTNCGDTYDGSYKVIEVNIKHGLDYQVSLTMMKE